MITSPGFCPSKNTPHEPTRMNVSAPMCASSSSAIATVGPPMPVAHTVMNTPAYVPEKTR